MNEKHLAIIKAARELFEKNRKAYAQARIADLEQVEPTPCLYCRRPLRIEALDAHTACPHTAFLGASS